jgi:flavin-dependent dehydrogenase
MDRFGARPGSVHGGYLATGWPAGVVDGIFTVGDAGGQCLPFSGEGIRTAVLAGVRCGHVLQQVLDGVISEDEAQVAYRAFVAGDRRRYRGLLAANLLVLALPQHWLARAAARLAEPRLRQRFFTHYLGIFASPMPGDAHGRVPTEPPADSARTVR